MERGRPVTRPIEHKSASQEIQLANFVLEAIQAWNTMTQHGAHHTEFPVNIDKVEKADASIVRLTMHNGEFYMVEVY